MSLNDLVASQPEEEVSTSSETEIGMEQSEEQASATSENNADVDVVEPTDVEEEQPGHKSRAPKRMQQLLEKQRELELELAREKAARETLERTTTPSEPKTLEDLDVAGLQRFISKAGDDPDLEEHLPRAKELLVEKQIEEKLNLRWQEQQQTVAKQQGEQLTNAMVANLSGNKLQDVEGEYYNTAQSYLYDLSRDEYSTIDQSQLLAVALAEIDYLKKQTAGPSLQERAVQGKNNKIIANNRGGAAGGDDLADFLKENRTLRTSRQGTNGNLNNAIRKLNAVTSLE